MQEPWAAELRKKWPKRDAGNLVDIKDEFVQRGFNMIRDTLQEGVERNIFTVEQVDEIISRIHGTRTWKN